MDVDAAVDDAVDAVTVGGGGGSGLVDVLDDGAVDNAGVVGGALVDVAVVDVAVVDGAVDVATVGGSGSGSGCGADDCSRRSR